MERSPEAEADTDAAVKLVEASIANVKRRHLKIGARVADAFLGDPFHSAYEQALASGNEARALAYVGVAVGLLSNYFEQSKIQGVQICAYLLAKQAKGDRVARGLLDAMAQAGLTGPNPG